MTQLRVTAGTRIHLGLIDAGEATPRLFGGCGFALTTPNISVTWENSPRLVFVNDAGLDWRAVGAIESALERLRLSAPTARGIVTVRKAPPQHIGLGVTTATVLACLRALDDGAGLALGRRRLLQFSGRGGASGVGVATFFEGGFVVDYGRRREPGVKPLPSGAAGQIASLAPFSRFDVPSGWSVRLVLPAGTRLSGEAERAFFERHIPIPGREVFEALALVHHGVVPAVAEGNLVALRASLRRLHAVGFKSRELRNQGNVVLRLFEGMQSVTNAAVGMSSMGPLLYMIGHREDITADAVSEVIARSTATDLGVVAPANVGAQQSPEASSV